MARPDAKLAAVRKFALSLPETTEEPHFESASFRVRGKIFVTVPPGEQHIHVFVPEDAREQALALHPGCLEKLWWGKSVRGLRLSLEAAPAAVMQQLVRLAWEHKAPKALLGRR
jgi:hypothetical protein